MFLVLTVVFFVFRLGGADPVSIMLPPDAMPQDAEKLTKKFGLDKPLMVQYVNFLKNAVLALKLEVLESFYLKLVLLGQEPFFFVAFELFF